MKTLFITLISFILIGLSPTTEIMNATFRGYTEGTYYFEDDDEIMYGFDSLDAKVSSQFDLTSDAFIGKKFKVTYTSMTDVNDDDEEFNVLSIIALELVE